MRDTSKSKFWSSDWFLGIIISLAVFAISQLGLLEPVERLAYDIGMKLTTRAANDKISIIAIDDKSIDQYGAWPWPRGLHAEMVQKLSRAKATAIGYAVPFDAPQLNPGQAQVKALIDYYQRSNLATKLPEEIGHLKYLLRQNRDNLIESEDQPSSRQLANFDRSALVKTGQRELSELGRRLAIAAKSFDSDKRTARAFAKAGNVLIPIEVTPGLAIQEPKLSLSVRKQTMPVTDNGAGGTGVKNLREPVAELANAARGIGALGKPDRNMGFRVEPLAYRVGDRLIPALSLMLAAQSLGLNSDDIRFGQNVRLGDLTIATNDQMQMNTFFYDNIGNKPAFEVFSFGDVQSGRVPAEKLKGKTVLIGLTAAEISTLGSTPLSEEVPAVIALASSLSSILDGDHVVTPEWASIAQLSAFLIVALYLISVLPRLRAGFATLATLILANVLVDGHLYLMTKEGMWLPLMGPTALLIGAHLLLAIKRTLATIAQKMGGNEESNENNKMLAMAFQSQGQLDMAFEKLRRCNMDETVMDLMYNLALDYERKRQFNKAGSVYQTMAEFNSKYKDVEKRINRVNSMSETFILGSTSPNTLSNALTTADGELERPMLGRYQVEKELGKGAMGIVYLGRDPKINRVVAIKTLPLSQEFEANELVEVKERFFREAETAGRLNHPNIVTIYDAGEEHDLAYIAMEFLKGDNLMEHTREDTLLPIPTVFNIVFKAALALDYAHKNSVIHRDIKPANIMYEAKSDTVKITDFGIARITDSSKTKTGTVLGTPSYMPPEQLAGKRVGGRSDLYSLGALFYQMLTARLPFEADSLASLMYKITNEPHVPARSIRPELPPCISKITDKALQKAPENRYQTGADFAKDLRLCARQISTSGKKTAAN